MLARKRKTSPILRIISARVGEDDQREGLQAGRPTLVRKAYLSGLANDLWILFCFFYGRGYQLFELQDWSVRKRTAKQKERGLTRDIFTDCESAYDSDNFVLRVD
jgi:hypothetical protein